MPCGISTPRLIPSKDISEAIWENTYRILLEHVLKRGGADPSRIGVDYLDDGSLLQSVLEQDRLPELVSEI